MSAGVSFATLPLEINQLIVQCLAAALYDEVTGTTDRHLYFATLKALRLSTKSFAHMRCLTDHLHRSFNIELTEENVTNFESLDSTWLGPSVRHLSVWPPPLMWRLPIDCYRAIVKDEVSLRSPRSVLPFSYVRPAFRS
jgi:hypothetical protein